MSSPGASVIVRAKNSARTIERTLVAVRDQTVAAELIVVDSGSEDGTLALARRLCDQILELPPREFSYGRALNRGARVARAPIHFALSAHAVPPRADWIERSIAHYRRPDVAATSGGARLPDGRPLTTPFDQSADHARAHPAWGFSNTASSWRADVWERFRFDEQMEACEDKEWGWRVLDAGYVIVLDPALGVGDRHRRRAGPRALYSRGRRESRALALRGALPPLRLREAVREWWCAVPADSRFPALLHRLDYLRAAEMAGRYAGRRQAWERPPG